MGDLDAIRQAISSNDVARARELLREALHEPTAETCFLASQVALSESQRLDFLQKALELDPFHESALLALESAPSRDPHRRGGVVPDLPGPGEQILGTMEGRDLVDPGVKVLPRSPRLPQVPRWLAMAGAGLLGLALLAVVVVFVILPLIQGDDGLDRVGEEVVSGEVVPGESQTFTGEDGFSVYLAPGAVAEERSLTVRIADGVPDAANDSRIIVGDVYDIDVGIEGLGDRALITLPYSREQVSGRADEDSILVGYYAEDISEWVALPSVVDRDARTVSALTDHLSLFAPLFWFSDNQPPTISTFTFSPSAFSVDCDALASDPGWLGSQPITLTLVIDDLDGLEDIIDPPEVSIREDWVFFLDKVNPIPMDPVGPGHYQMVSALGKTDLGLFAIPNTCGQLKTLIAEVRVKDSVGHTVEQSAFLDVRYWPIPVIDLQSPTGGGLGSSTPTLKWTVSGAPEVLEEFEYLQLVISSDGALKESTISERLPLDSTSYRVQYADALEVGHAYYWQVTAHEAPQPVGKNWHFVGSQIGSFVVTDIPEVITTVYPAKAKRGTIIDVFASGLAPNRTSTVRLTGPGLYNEILNDELMASNEGEASFSIGTSDLELGNYEVVVSRNDGAGQASATFSLTFEELPRASLTVDGTRIHRSVIENDTGELALDWSVYQDGELLFSNGARGLETLDLDSMSPGEYTVVLQVNVAGSTEERELVNISNSVVVEIERDDESKPDLRNGLVAYYPFDENANDLSVNSYHGTLEGATIVDDGRWGYAAYFDGNDYIEFPEPVVWQPPYSVSFWFMMLDYPIAWDSAGIYRDAYLVSNGGQTGGAQGFTFYISMSPGVVCDEKEYPNGGVVFGFRNEEIQWAGSASYPIELNRWYHVVGTWDGTKDLSHVKLYVDGKADSVYKCAVEIEDKDHLPNNLRAGAPSNDNRQYFFDGYIDEVLIFSRVLTQEEILKLEGR